MHLLLIPVILFANAQDSTQAEKAFHASVQKLVDAETVQISVDGIMKGAKGDITLKGTVLMAKGNKSRLDLTGETFSQALSFASISDGVKTKVEMIKGGKGGNSKVQDTSKNANSLLTNIMSRAGLLAGLNMNINRVGPGQKQLGIDELLAVSDFSLGTKENIGDRSAQRIDYMLSINRGKKKQSITGQVWLDSDTNLPLKRVLRGKDGGEKFQVVETYEIRINTNIEASKFQLPK